MKYRVGRLIGLLGLYFVPLYYSEAQTELIHQSFFEPGSSAYLESIDLTQSFDGKIHLVTKNRKSGSNGYILHWSIGKIDSWNGTQVFASDQIAIAEPVCDKNSEIALNLPSNWKDGDLLNLSLQEEADREIIYGISEPIHKPKEGNQSYFSQRPEKENHKIRMRESTSDFQVDVGEILYVFNKERGNLQLLKIGSKFINFSQNSEQGSLPSSLQNLMWKRLKD